ncbi:hypothetical protein AJ88_21620 [Mesorhizobium amorphae CCBAU 01583]|nr:hypothetical protein AJ88_21620 [Mesorhizobium amorphae CCBAU 01583]
MLSEVGSAGLARRRGAEARQRHQLRPALKILVNTFNDDAAEIVPQFEEGIAVAFGQLSISLTILPVTPLRIAARVELSWIHLAREVERKVGGVDQAPQNRR